MSHNPVTLDYLWHVTNMIIVNNTVSNVSYFHTGRTLTLLSAKTLLIHFILKWVRGLVGDQRHSAGTLSELTYLLWHSAAATDTVNVVIGGCAALPVSWLCIRTCAGPKGLPCPSAETSSSLRCADIMAPSDTHTLSASVTWRPRAWWGLPAEAQNRR